MLYRLVYNVRSHFNELILACAYFQKSFLLINLDFYFVPLLYPILVQNNSVLHKGQGHESRSCSLFDTDLSCTKGGGYSKVTK